MIAVQVLDDFLPNPEGFRDTALRSPYYDIRGPDGELYKHISVRPTDELTQFLSNRLGRQVTLDYSLLRVNFEGELPNNAIHSDNSYSEYAFVLYLNLPKQCRGGTAFWRHKKYGWTSYPTELQCHGAVRSPAQVCRQLLDDYNDGSKWEQIHLAEMKFNRCIVYPTKQFHSRWPFAAWGDRMENARLINVGFFSV